VDSTCPCYVRRCTLSEVYLTPTGYFGSWTEVGGTDKSLNIADIIYTADSKHIYLHSKTIMLVPKIMIACAVYSSLTERTTL
jgi:hypothetical protein